MNVCVVMCLLTVCVPCVNVKVCVVFYCQHLVDIFTSHEVYVLLVRWRRPSVPQFESVLANHSLPVPSGIGLTDQLTVFCQLIGGEICRSRFLCTFLSAAVRLRQPGSGLGVECTLCTNQSVQKKCSVPQNALSIFNLDPDHV